MQKFLVITFLIISFVCPVQAQTVSYLEEVGYLGAIAGQGLACDASKYHTYELLARAILISKAKSDSQQEEGMKVYNDQKAGNFISVVSNDLSECPEINKSFNEQKIFKSTLYGDGTIKMFDGKIITPRHPYDANLVYKKDPNAREKYLELYQKSREKTLNDPVYQRALREQQRKHGF